jgi:hypothetical protein
MQEYITGHVVLTYSRVNQSITYTCVRTHRQYRTLNSLYLYYFIYMTARDHVIVSLLHFAILYVVLHESKPLPDVVIRKLSSHL